MRYTDPDSPVAMIPGGGCIEIGLTKREHFAAMAMQGWLANKDRPQHFQPKDDMDYCVKIADALCSALNGGASGG